MGFENVLKMLNIILGRIGLSYAKFLPKDTEWEGSFEVLLILHNFNQRLKLVSKVRKKTLLNKEDIACSEVIHHPDHSGIC